MKWWDRYRQNRWLKKKPPSLGTGNIGGEQIPTKLAVDPINGRRVWRVAVDRATKQLGLQSVHVGIFWEPHMVAECRGDGYKYGRGGHDDSPPSPTCACGLYAQLPDQRIDEWWFAIGGRVHATGDVALSGRVIKCTRGYKAQYADIVPPVFLDVTCSGQSSHCPNQVTKVGIPEGALVHYWGYCQEHADPEAPLIDADVWMREAVRELTDRYEFEFLTWR